MKPLTLEDLVPQTGEFTVVDQAGVTHMFALRPFSLLDEVWLSQNYPGTKLQEVFSPEKLDMVEICRIAYHQLETEHQKFFVKQEIEIYNEDGDREVMVVGGYRMLAAMVCGFKAQADLISAVAKTRGVSQAVLDKMEAESTEKKTPITTGRTSSMRSVTSTAGRKNMSSRARPGKSNTL